MDALMLAFLGLQFRYWAIIIIVVILIILLVGYFVRRQP